MSESIFCYRPEEYQQDINPIEHYIEQASLYISKVKNISLIEAEKRIREAMANKEGPFANITDRVIRYTHKKENGDREIVTGSLIQYIQNLSRQNVIVAPTLTTYIPHGVKEAISVKFVENNKKDRSVAKKLKFQYKLQQNPVQSNYYDIMQKFKKIINNSFSGAFSSPYTILYFKTGHNTLTSATRMTTSNSNSLNEKFLTGNRHYYSIDAIINNLIYIVSQTPKETIKQLIEKYRLHVPTVEDCLAVIQRSANLYCLYRYESACLSVLNHLDSYERTFFVYCNDFYHLYFYNPELLSEFISKSTELCHEEGEFTKGQVLEYPQEYRMMATQICYRYVRGYGDNYEKMQEEGILKFFIPTMRNSYNTIQQYADLLQGFFRNKIFPHSISYFPQSVRRCILTSDTDSTIPTYQEIIFQYLGKKEYSDKGRAALGLLILLTSYVTSNVLMNMSAHFNTDRKRLKNINMKSEFTFDVYVTTQMAKHYYATISVQEGNAFKKVDREVKGVNLVSSNLPLRIRQEAKDLMNDIMDKTLLNEKLSITTYLQKVKEIEESIINSIKKGEITYFKVFKVKGKESYREDQFNAYHYALLWDMVFSVKSAKIESFPYQAIKISVTIDNKKRMMEWVETLDPIMKEQMMNWLKMTKRTELGMIMLPADVIRTRGIPEEIQAIIDYRKLIKEICNIFYIILDSIGFSVKRDFIVSDYFRATTTENRLDLLD